MYSEISSAAEGSGGSDVSGDSGTGDRGTVSNDISNASQWVSNTATVVNDIVSSYYQVMATTESEKRALALAERQRKDSLAQQAAKNRQTQMSLELAQSAFSFDKMKWGKSWKMTKRQYQDQRDAAMAEMQRTGRLDAQSGFNMYNQQTSQLRNQLVGQMGV